MKFFFCFFLFFSPKWISHVQIYCIKKIPKTLHYKPKPFVHTSQRQQIYCSISYLCALHASRAIIAFLGFCFDFVAILAAKLIGRSKSFLPCYLNKNLHDLQNCGGEESKKIQGTIWDFSPRRFPSSLHTLHIVNGPKDQQNPSIFLYFYIFVVFGFLLTILWNIFD